MKINRYSHLSQLNVLPKEAKPRAVRIKPVTLRSRSSFLSRSAIEASLGRLRDEAPGTLPQSLLHVMETSRFITAQRRRALAAIVAFRYLEYVASETKPDPVQVRRRIAEEVSRYRGFYHLALELLNDMHIGAENADDRTLYSAVADAKTCVADYLSGISRGEAVDNDPTAQSVYTFHTARMAYATLLTDLVIALRVRSGVEVTMTRGGFAAISEPAMRTHTKWDDCSQTLLASYEAALSDRESCVQIEEYTAWGPETVRATRYADSSSNTPSDTSALHENTVENSASPRAAETLNQMYQAALRRRPLRDTKRPAQHQRVSSLALSERAGSTKLVLHKGGRGTVRHASTNVRSRPPLGPLTHGDQKTDLKHDVDASLEFADGQLVFPNESTGIPLWTGVEEIALLRIIGTLWDALEQGHISGTFTEKSLSSSAFVAVASEEIWETRDVSHSIPVQVHAIPDHVTSRTCAWRDVMRTFMTNLVHQDDLLATREELLRPVFAAMAVDPVLSKRERDFVAAVRSEETSEVDIDDQNLAHLARAHAFAGRFLWHGEQQFKNYLYVQGLDESSTDSVVVAMQNLLRAVKLFYEKFDAGWRSAFASSKHRPPTALSVTDGPFERWRNSSRRPTRQRERKVRGVIGGRAYATTSADVNAARRAVLRTGMHAEVTPSRLPRRIAIPPRPISSTVTRSADEDSAENAESSDTEETDTSEQLIPSFNSLPTLPPVPSDREENSV